MDDGKFAHFLVGAQEKHTRPPRMKCCGGAGPSEAGGEEVGGVLYLEYGHYTNTEAALRTKRYGQLKTI